MRTHKNGGPFFEKDRGASKIRRLTLPPISHTCVPSFLKNNFFDVREGIDKWLLILKKFLEFWLEVLLRM